MNLDEYQKSRIQEFVYDEWVDENDNEDISMQNLKSLLSKITSPIELDEMIKGFNFDCGTEELKHLIDHPLIHSATVLRLFWMSGPGYFCKYQFEEDIQDNEKSSFDMIKYIYRKLETILNEDSIIQFNPRNDEGYNWVDAYKREELKLPKKGITPFFQIDDNFRSEIKNV